MADEAEGLGISIDERSLSERLRLPVCRVSARRGTGMEHLRAVMTACVRGEGRRTAEALDGAYNGLTTVASFAPLNERERRRARLALPKSVDAA